eukprot:CAMPEP_0175238902 /NCGR_PEP_ID=MMETSP0093-20121207/29271_1 /TAXON_ID=311494 /ORGANISM="Alexandrium monilatum, Strain CCMP3105" /LENGTH=30 /DNA_ID= /DNA_START= /DNA_END= /DNA_ORIENTATION=
MVEARLPANKLAAGPRQRTDPRAPQALIMT